MPCRPGRWFRWAALSGLALSAQTSIGQQPLDEVLGRCAPTVALELMRELIRQESGFRPFVIGVDAGQPPIARQPTSLDEAVELATDLVKRRGPRFSVGLAQIHASNVARLGLTWQQAFDPCHNVATGERILWSFYRKALASGYSDSLAVWAALRGYNSGSVNAAVSTTYADSILSRLRIAPSAGHPVPAAPVAVHVPGDPRTTDLLERVAGREEGEI